MMKLVRYNKKRNFKNTPEPKGKVSLEQAHLFVIQKHAASHLHYDFRLELNGVLLSWAVPKGPCLDPTVKRLAVHVEDHPVAYGNFEGIIPAGEYGGGTVMLWDRGQWLPLDDDPALSYKKGHLKFILKAEKLKGTWNLIKFKKDDEKSWFLIKSKDKYARPLLDYDITLKKPNSVLSKHNLDEIKENYEKVWTSHSKESAKKKVKKSILDFPPTLKKTAFPHTVSPELATLVDKPPAALNVWLHEIKLDGYRIIAYKNDKTIRLMSRNHLDWTNKFKNIAKEIAALPIKKIIFDGELVIHDENHKTNFQALQNTIGQDGSFNYYIFDLLYYDQYNLMKLPLIERKKFLKQVLDFYAPNDLIYNDHIIGNGNKILKHACELGLEGIVSKQTTSIYEEKRSKAWLKSKCTKRQEFIICGYSPPSGARNYFGSLYLGYYDKDGKLQFCGNVGTGFTETSLKKIFTLLRKYTVTKNPFPKNPPGIKSATWVKPKLVAEVEFSEWTSEGSLRHPSFKGLREDKPINKITKEKQTHVDTIFNKEVDMKTDLIKLTHPEKLLYPEAKITKLDVAEYYAHIAPWILPYITNRPLTLVRCPENYKHYFYQKHTNKSTSKNLLSVKIKEKNGSENYIYINDIEGLMSLVQMSVLEIHPWGSTINRLEYPDFITIDLDPAEDVHWRKVVLAANRIKTHLSEFKLKSFVKTTGGKGLHIVVPILPEYSWNEVKNFTHVFVSFLASEYLNEYVTEMSKAKRGGKIFIDYLRNARGATSVAAYSTRARENATVSVPLDWDELTKNSKDTSFDIFTTQKRLKNLTKDPWEDFFKIKQSLRLNKI